MSSRSFYLSFKWVRGRLYRRSLGVGVIVGLITGFFSNPKQILEIFRLLSNGKETPYEELCDIFNNETDNGSKMSTYNELLKTAIGEINRVFKKRANTRLTNNRDAFLIPKAKKDESGEQFELITWLIIR